MPLKVVLSKTAERDLASIARWVAERTDLPTALAYVGRVDEACRSLTDFPARDRDRDRGRGLRSNLFKRLALVTYRVLMDRVRTIGLYHAGRDPDAR